MQSEKKLDFEKFQERVLGGNIIQELTSEVVEDLKSRIAQLEFKPKLAGVFFDRTKDDTAYENTIKKLFAEIGIEYESHDLSKTSVERVKTNFDAINKDLKTSGIIVFGDIPKKFAEKVRAIIDPAKDVDAIGDRNLLDLVRRGHRPLFVPAVSRAIMHIIQTRFPDGLVDKNIQIINRSDRIATPLRHLTEDLGMKSTNGNTQTPRIVRKIGETPVDVYVVATNNNAEINDRVLVEESMGEYLEVGSNGNGRLSIKNVQKVKMDPQINFADRSLIIDVGRYSVKAESVDPRKILVRDIGRLTTAWLAAHTVQAEEMREKKRLENK